MSSILIKKVDVYSPEPKGVMDILIINEQIVALDSKINLPRWLSETKVIKGDNLKAVPGFIDAYVYIIGGGGESGFSSQVPPVQLSTLIKSGITTVGGLLGTDTVTRNVASVLAKANSLYEEGISSFIVSGGYPIESPTITGNIRSDVTFIEKVRGGKIALSDHRASPVSPEQLLSLGIDIRVGGMLRGFAGMLIMHIGSGAECLDIVFQVLDKSPCLGRHFIATHINRNYKLLNDSIKLTKKGGYMDISSGLNTSTIGSEAIKPSTAIFYALENGAVKENILMSSDGNGSAAKYGNDGSVNGLVASDPMSIYYEFIDCIKEGLTLTEALSPVTRNVAKAFSFFPKKGTISVNSDADILLLDKKLDIKTVISRGAVMMDNGVFIKKGSFEN